MKNKLIVAIFLFIMATTTFVFGVFSLSAVNTVEPQGSISYVAYKARKFSNSTYTYYTSIQAAIETASDGDIIEVIRSHTLSAPITVSKKITLMASDGINVSLTRGESFYGNMLQVLAGGELNLGTSVVGYTGLLTFDGENRQLGQYGQPLIQTVDVLKMYDGIQLVNNLVSNKALAVNVASGSFYLYGGSILNNKSNDFENSGVIYLNNGTFGYFCGGSIYVPDNTIKQYAIYSENARVDVTATNVYAQTGYNAIMMDGTLSETRAYLNIRNSAYVEGVDLIKTYFNLSGGVITKTVTTENNSSFDVFSGGGNFDIITSTNASLDSSDIHLYDGTVGNIYLNSNNSLQVEGDPTVGGIYLATGKRISVVNNFTSITPLPIIPSDYTFGRVVALFSAGLTAGKDYFTLVDAETYSSELIVVGQEIRIGTTEEFEIAVTPSYVYDGQEKTPSVTVKMLDETLTKDVDYDLSGDLSATNVGVYEITVTGLGNYMNHKKSKTWSITPDPTSLEVTLTESSFIYSGDPITPYISQVKAGLTTFLTPSDYEIVTASSTLSATNIGDYVITVRGIGNYSGTGTAEWHITALALTSVTFTDVTYNGVAQTPVVASITPSGATFDITSITKNSVEYISTGAIDAGTYTVTVVGTGNYEGTLSADWTITTKELTATWGTTSFTYNGSTQKPSATINGIESGDVVTVTVATDPTPSIDVGEYIATVTLSGTDSGNYTISATKSFTIGVATMYYTVTPYSGTYDGATHYASITMTTPTSVKVGYSGTNGTYTTYTLSSVKTTAVNFSSMGRKDYGTTTIYFQITAPNYTTVTGSTTVVVNKYGLAITEYSVTWSGAATYARDSYSTEVNSETINLTYTPYTTSVGTYIYAASASSGKFTLALSSSNYSVSSAGNFTINTAVAQNARTGTCYSTIASAVEYATTGDTILVIASHLITTAVTVDKNLTITADSDFTVKRGSDATFNTQSMFTISSGCTLTFGGGTGDTGIVTIDGNNISVSTSGTVFANDGTLIISSGTFTKNESTSYGGVISNNATLTINGGTFEYNEATFGGVIYQSGTDGVIDITNSSFTNNTATQSGGVIYNLAINFSLTITGGFYNDNSSTNGSGGVIYTSLGNEAADINIIINGPDINGNSSASSGSAIYVSNTFSTESSVSITFTNLEGNSATSDATIYGGVIYTNYVDLTLGESCTIDWNFVDTNSAEEVIVYGVAVYASNAVVELLDGLTFDTNYSAKENIVVYGGALYLVNVTLNIDDTYFYSNEATDGGAIYISNSTGTIGNVYCSENEAYNGGVFYITNSSSITLKYTSEYYYNTAENDGSVIYLNNSSLMTNEIWGVFQYNIAKRYATIYTTGGSLSLTAIGEDSIEFSENTSFDASDIYANALQNPVINMGGNVNIAGYVYLNSDNNFVNVTSEMLNTTAIKLGLNSSYYTIGRKIVDFGELYVQLSKFILTGNANYELIVIQNTLAVGSAQPLQFNLTGTLNYNGSSQEPTYTITVGGIELVKDATNGYEIINEGEQLSVVSATNAGTYTIYIKGKGNYINKTGSFQWTILPQSVVITLNSGADSSGTTTGSWVWASNAYTQTLSATGISTLGTLPSPTKTGYTFAGWETVGAVAVSASTILPATDTTYNAVWNLNSYSITYNYASGTAVATNPTAILFGISFSVSAPTRNGYTFTGWTLTGTNPDYNTAKFGVASGTITTAISSSSVKAIGSSPTANTYFINLASVNGAVTLTATWTPTNYTITLNQNGATTNGSTSATATYNSSTLTTITNPLKTGYTFAGWTITLDGNDTLITTGGAFVAIVSGYTDASSRWIRDNTATAYAKWTIISYTLTLKSVTGTVESGTGGTVKINSGTAGATASASINYNESTTATATVATGYTFNGWYSAITGGTKLSTNAAYTFNMPASVTTYYARYTIKTYTITLNQNGATTNGSTSATATYNSSTLTTITNPLKTGYTFAGWTITQNGTDTLITTSGTLTASVSGYTDSSSKWVRDNTATVYAKWTVKTYTITLNQNGATTNGSTSATATYNSSTLTAITNPLKTGYTFAGWTITQNGTDTLITTSGTLTASVSGYTDSSSKWVRDNTATVYAKWNVITYSITYAYADGTAGTTNPTSKDFGSSFYVSAPTKNGYTFTGWTLTGTNPDYNTAKYGVNSGTITTAISSSSVKAIGSSATADTYLINLASVNGSVTLTATWTPTVYTIIYNENGGSALTDQTYKITDGTITLPTTITRANYVFASWKVTSVTANTVYKASGSFAAVNDTITQVYTGSFGNITVQAQWDVAYAQNENTGVYYASISDAVTYATTGHTILVLASHTITSANAVTIDKNLTIKANTTVTITRANSDDYCLFYVKSSKTLIFGTLDSSIITVDGNSFFSNEFSAFDNQGTLIINEGNFINHNVYNGSVGAVINNEGTLTINGGTFTGNTADYGPVVGNRGTVNITDGIFKGNYAKHDGGVIFNIGESGNTASVTITGGTFGGTVAGEGNTATYGGVIYNSSYGEVNISDASFIRNLANYVENVENSGQGGVIYNAGTSVTIISGTFTSNTSDYNGGVIYNEATLTINNGTFKSNGASTSGGVIENTLTGSVSITGGVFGGTVEGEGNLAGESSGGAIDNDGTLSLITGTGKSIRFYGNNAGETGDDIYSSVGFNIGGDVENTSEFVVRGTITVSATLTNTNANAIKIFGPTDGTPAVTFTSYQADQADKFVSSNSEYTLYRQGNNLYMGPNDAVAVNDTTKIFYQTISSAVTDATADDTILVIASHTITSAVTVDKNLTITADDDFTVKRDALFTSTMFTINSGYTLTFGGGTGHTGVITIDGNNVNGGVILNNGTLTINSGTFSNNHSTSGAVIYARINSLTTILGGDFTNNFASGDGGVISGDFAGLIAISGGNFTGNSATKGGVINNYRTRTANDGGGLRISGGTFKGNSASERGGVIYSDSDSYTDFITDGTFGGTGEGEGNSAPQGGVIYNGGSTLTISDASFINNSASGEGGVIYNIGTLTINSGTFSSNFAINGGGVIVAWYGSINTILGGDFTNNSASGDGGVIYNYGISVTISGGTFEYNEATLGGVIFNATGTISISGSTTSISSTGDGSIGIYNNSTGTVNISGSATIYGGNYGIYNNSTGTINLEGSPTITGGRFGIYLNEVSTSTAYIKITGNLTLTNHLYIQHSSANYILSSQDYTLFIVEKLHPSYTVTDTQNETIRVYDSYISSPSNYNDYGWLYGTGWNSTFYTDALSWAKWDSRIFKIGAFSCFSSDTYITVWDEKRKKLRRKKAKDIKYTDKILVWNFDKGCYDFANPLTIQKEDKAFTYYEVYFSDGSVLEIFNDHAIFNVDKNMFTPMVSDDSNYGSPVGTRVMNDKGEIVTITDKKKVNKQISYTNIFTFFHLNLYANGILTSTAFNNMYPIKDMKFVTDDRQCHMKSLLDGINDEWRQGMRLDIIPDNIILAGLRHFPDCKTFADYVNKKILMEKPKE